jgi:Cu+-exporting ATPase
VAVWAAWPFYERAVASVRNRSLNMFTLIGLGVGVAYGYSLVAAFCPGLPATHRDGGTVPVYFEAAAVITALVLLGQVLELKGARRDERGDPQAARARQRRPPRGGSAPNGSEEDVALEVRRGRRPPARPAGREGPGRRRRARRPQRDRRVDGLRRADARSRRGGRRSSAPPSTAPAAFVMRAEKVGSETLLARIVAMVAAAQRSRAPIQKLADQISGWFVLTCWRSPAADLRALGDARAGAAPGARPRQRGRRADHRLPVRARARDADVDHGGDGQGASMGVLFRNAEAIELLRKVDTLVVDKTGTLTEGKPTCDRRGHSRSGDLVAGQPLRHSTCSRISCAFGSHLRLSHRCCWWPVLPTRRR